MLKQVKGFHVDGPMQVSLHVYGGHLKGCRPLGVHPAPAQGGQPGESVSKETRQTEARKKQEGQPNVTDGEMTKTLSELHLFRCLLPSWFLQIIPVISSS